MYICVHIYVLYMALEKRKKPPPLVLTLGQEIVGDFYFTNKLELALDYLRCLVLAPDLAKKGFKNITHKEPVAFYSGLLAVLDGSKMQEAVADIQDDAPMMELVQQPMVLALCDGDVEGEPDSDYEEFIDYDDEESRGRHKAAGGSFERWGSFTLRDFQTKKNGVIKKQLLMRCPYHHDAGNTNHEQIKERETSIATRRTNQRTRDKHRNDTNKSKNEIQATQRR